MAQPSKPSPPVKRGPALDLSDEDLDALAVIVEADILRAQQEAQRLLPSRYRNLLQATELDNGTAAG